MKTINALAARSRLGTVLDEVSQKRVHYVIERLSHPLVAVIPFDEYQNYVKDMDKKNTRQVGKKLLAEILEFRKKYANQLRGGEDSVTIIRKQREERTKQILAAVHS